MYPSLRGLQAFRLPWSALLPYLAAQLPLVTNLPLRSCRWHDGKGEHLILLSATDYAPAHLGAHSGGAHAGDGAHGGGVPIVHCEVRSGGELRLRTCSTRLIGETGELLSELGDSVANAVVCWTWTASRLPQGYHSAG